MQQAAPLLRGSTPEFEGFMTAMFASMHGSTPAAEAAALAVRRRPRQDVVTGIWTPLLDWSPADLDAFVERTAAAVTVPVLSLHGLDPGPDYAAWLTARIPTATVEHWTDDAGADLATTRTCADRSGSQPACGSSPADSEPAPRNSAGSADDMWGRAVRSPCVPGWRRPPGCCWAASSSWPGR